MGSRADLEAAALAQLELERRAARRDLIAYAHLSWDGYRPAGHHRLIADALQRVADGETRRLMLFVPPRHGKSMLASEYFPAQYLGRWPDRDVIAATYAQGLADDFGRKVRNLLTGTVHQAVFPGCRLAGDSRAADRLHTSEGGAYYAVGAGGPITGRGAHLLVIDDPIKGREDADSELMRQRLKDWYTSVARTRLMPGGAIVVIQCMTGDTPVLMADGKERPLCDVRPGDRVATLRGDELTTSTVLNHANNGRDYVFQMRMTSGIMVRANERHPFLVERDGEWKWLKIGEIVAGNKVRRVIGVSGKEKPVASMGVNPQPSAGECATPTTAEPNGLVDTGHHVKPTHTKSETGNSGTGMESGLLNMTPSLPSKGASARSASVLKKKGPLSTGMPSPSTTATRLDESEGCSATTATSSLDAGAMLKSCNAPLSTFRLTEDTVAEILPCGLEDVFDLQVEGTENFIANGLVSHNTRWHEDDLAGWLLREHTHEQWETINLPALAEPGDALGRAEGEPLWPEAYSLEDLQALRQSVGARDWAALYQQRPSAAEGAIFKREHWQYHRPAEHNPLALVESLGCHHVVQAWDTAFKTKSSNDYSVCVTLGVTPSRYYVLDVWRDRCEFPDLKRALIAQQAKWRAHSVVIEDTAAGQSLLQELRRDTRLPLIPVQTDRDKMTRAYVVTPTHEAGLVYLPEGEPWVSDFVDELAGFPTAPHDDQVDAFVHALTWARDNVSSRAPRPKDDRPITLRPSPQGWMR